ncbi:hypothetical protein [Variovorax boronicumulans]|uniref:hypothetical protein n=1 Tax=Variovorax boronicumulans TaxID=436515 RepID=UPI0027898AC1|nr:hypothetical protein [Variovorax boronicumulans]MDP9990914.1 ferritin-like metal-binding protein YciE [Variovorax boronicumulans]
MKNDQAVLVELAAVKGQLQMLMLMIQTNHDSTHQRIDDLRRATEGRIEGLDERLATIERNERSTALKAASGGALSGAMVGGAIELFKFVAKLP